MSPPHMRPMTAEDLPAVIALEAGLYSHPWTRGNFRDSLAAGYLAEVLLAAKADPPDTLLGYYVALPGVDELHLLNLSVGPAAQGQGWGRQLLQRVLDQAQARELTTVWLEVRQSNERARAVYRHRGFEEVGLRRAYYPARQGREDAVVMRLTLHTRAPLPLQAPTGCAHALD